MLDTITVKYDSVSFIKKLCSNFFAIKTVKLNKRPTFNKSVIKCNKKNATCEEKKGNKNILFK